MRNLSSLCVVLPLVATFSPQPTVSRKGTALNGIFGRFRNKKEVEQVKEIKVGDTIPDIDVEQLITDDEGESSTEIVSIREVLKGPSILIGMPGAFTPTCSKEHLPGYITNAKKFAELGIETVGVVTTNDRFVNQEWMDAQGQASKSSHVTMISDGDGDLVKQMGLADDMGFGVGIRSKRFVLLTDNEGKVQKIFSDEGMDECSSTSAENIIRVLSPETEVLDADTNPAVLTGVGVVIAGAVLYAAQNYGTLHQ